MSVWARQLLDQLPVDEVFLAGEVHKIQQEKLAGEVPGGGGGGRSRLHYRFDWGVAMVARDIARSCVVHRIIVRLHNMLQPFKEQLWLVASKLMRRQMAALCFLHKAVQYPLSSHVFLLSAYCDASVHSH
jgi:hypothetical protein